MVPDQLTINRQLRRGGFGKYYETTDENGIAWFYVTDREPREDREEVIRFLRDAFKKSAKGES